MRHTQEAGRVPGQENRFPPSPGGQRASPGCQTSSACGVSLQGHGLHPRLVQGFIEEFPPPFPSLGLSFLKAPRGVKARRAFPWEADLFSLSAGTRTFTPAGRVQLPAEGCSTRHCKKCGALPPAGGIDLPSAHLGVADESKGTLGCAPCSTPVRVLPAIPTAAPQVPYQLSPLQMVMELVLEN